MEAEAQCAELVRLGLVDGIVTDDSDVFLFGGTRVYRHVFNRTNLVECYLASDLERELLASDLVALFRRFSTSWGDQLHSVLANAIMVFLYNTKPGHIGDLRKFLIEARPILLEHQSVIALLRPQLLRQVRRERAQQQSDGTQNFLHRRRGDLGLHGVHLVE